MNWFILALCAGALTNIFHIFNRSSLKEKGDSTVYGWWFEFFRFIAFLVLFSFNPLLPKEQIAYIWLAVLGFTEIGSIYFFMRSHQLNELSLSTFVIKLQLIWTPLFAIIFIGEKLSFNDYGGIGIILLGIFIAVYSKGLKKDKGMVITLIASVFIALLSVSIKKATEYTTTAFILMAMSLPSILILPLFMKDAQKRIVGISKNRLINNMLGATANILAMFLSVSAVRIGSTSKVQAVVQGMMIISLLYSIFVLKENKSIWQKIIGASIIAVGLYQLAL